MRDKTAHPPKITTELHSLISKMGHFFSDPCKNMVQTAVPGVPKFGNLYKQKNLFPTEPKRSNAFLQGGPQPVLNGVMGPL